MNGKIAEAAPSPKTSRPESKGSGSGSGSFDLARALLEDELITEGQLSRAERVQKKLKRPRSLESVLSTLGFLFRRDLRAVYSKRGQKLPLGYFLIERGAVTPEAVDAALAAQANGDKRRLGEILIASGELQERTLLEALGEQLGWPVLTPDLSVLDRSLLGKFSMAFLKRRVVLPLSRVNGGVMVLLAAAPDDETRHDLEKILERKLVFALAMKAEIQEALHALEMGLGPNEPLPSAQRPVLTLVNQANPTSAMGSKASTPADEPPSTSSGRRPSTPQEAVSSSARDSSVDVPSVSENETSVVALVDAILEKAVVCGASDVHIEPHEKGVRVRYRIDGELEKQSDIPSPLGPPIVGRIKVLGECDLAEHRRHQDGRFKITRKGGEVDVRLSVFASLYGESLVMRLLHRRKGVLRLEELGMPPAAQQRFREEVLQAPAGVVMVTGPTGAGKTSTLYAAVAHANRPNIKIITLEDPVEYSLDGIIQCQINPKIGQNFPEALRAVVRQDPEMVVLGEVRDAESAQAAIQVSLTGHKVFSTLHTEDSVGGFLRLQYLSVERFLIASTVTAVIAQRLVRKVCSECNQPYRPTSEELKYFGLVPKDVEGYKLIRGRGCPACRDTGYRGRTGVYELMIPSDEVKEALIQQASASEIRRIAIQTAGMVPLQEAAIAQVLRGATTFDEVRDNIPRHSAQRKPDEFMKILGYESRK